MTLFKAILPTQYCSHKTKLQDYIHIIQLTRSHNLGCVNFRKAIQQFGSAKNAIYALEENPKILGRTVTLCQYDIALKEYETAIESGAECVSFQDTDFPVLLSQIYDCPPFFWLKGNRNILQKNLCAIVGARNASVGGRKIAFSLAKNLGLNDFISVSGLASGIDTAVHQGSIKTGTIGVLASGVNIIYPQENISLAQDILANNGAIISEAPPHAPPQATMFIKRNRIISGLSLGTVVIEATEKSGSLSTAELALEHNREVFAVPGSPLDARAGGTNRLLRNGANWVENSDDVISVLHGIIQHRNLNKIIQESNKHNAVKPLITKKQNYLHSESYDSTIIKPIIVTLPETKPKEKANSTEDNILNLLSTTPISCDDLVRLTNIPSHKLLSIISMMELDGIIIRHHGNMITKSIKKLA